MIHHSSVSLDYLEERLKAGRGATSSDGPLYRLTFTDLAYSVRAWRSQGYTYAPACDNVTPDGSCAGHERGDDK